ncbi:GyrI-like domain-containing protein [Fictibacillus sp. b24]|uniref:GyrI-like domain-containing protein n=1 Tax=Fictibacillus sp. b24 TaxID=3055863 RepID=UPI0025A2795A|nr:GyrI-like domain-containing protein [Fictibacillus sp. b24]MDM5317036.1 GyrI-like domain-containing protein [Fictibacillus sp. b24]
MKTKIITHDHRKIHSDIYRMKPGPVSVRKIPAMSYITQEMNTAYRMDWAGRPEPIDEAWLVWKVVNQLKNITKNTLDYKFTLMPHEILWHEKNDERSLAVQMMQVPDCITEEMFEEAKLHVAKNLKSELPRMELIKSESVLCVQKLHIGHYRDTNETLKEIFGFAEQEGYKLDKSYREIYLTPAMMCHKPATWKTVVSVGIHN